MHRGEPGCTRKTTNDRQIVGAVKKTKIAKDHLQTAVVK